MKKGDCCTAKDLWTTNLVALGPTRNVTKFTQSLKCLSKCIRVFLDWKHKRRCDTHEAEGASPGFAALEAIGLEGEDTRAVCLCRALKNNLVL